ncbi:hypothetical protein CCR75_002311 [Bremia lactucae]|uniref:FAD-binding FR-type domain-containing protein n=1 Tax=Bremia lactucae TaxID=4779 RepID=A0A976FHZ7_BRELC|nr:hypothetical protein CCR75_002311 [Bremia lactucae]
MERRKASLSPPECSPETDPDVSLLLDHNLNDPELVILTPPRPCCKHIQTTKRLQEAVMQLLLWGRRNIAKVFLTYCGIWILFSLCWIRWPIYERQVVPVLKTRLGDTLEVEPFVVSVALVFPFFLAGLVFYWQQDIAGTITRWEHELKVVEWIRSHLNIGKRFGFDAIDVVFVGGFLLLQLNLVVGKLLIDNENGKLAKLGIVVRTARALGMNGLYAILLSVLLVAKQSFLHKVFGLSGEKAARYHTLCGHFGFLMLVIHGGLYTVVWYMQEKVEQMLFPCISASCSPKQRYGSIRNFCGAVAMLFFSIVAISSINWARRRFYRYFIVLHWFNAGFVVLTVLHYYAACFWLIPAIILYGMYCAVSNFGRGNASVVSATAISNKYVALELRRAPTNKSDFLPGQYVYIKINAIGKEWHPFTICSSPLRNRHSFFLHAKVYGHFTSQMLHLLQMHQLETIEIDGYYGTPIKLFPHMVFLAGGTGMTPFLSLLDHLIALVHTRNRETSRTFKSKLPQTLWIIWTCRDITFLQAHADILKAVNQCSQWHCKIYLHVTQSHNFESENDTFLTESDKYLSVNSQQYFPAPMKRYAFSGHNYMLTLPLYLGTVLGCVVSMLWVVSLKQFTAKSFLRRILLLLASVLGTMLGASLVLFIMQRWNAWKEKEESLNGAISETEVKDLDVFTRTPLACTATLNRYFIIEKERPDLKKRFCEIHKIIREKDGKEAKVAVFVSGPATLQLEVLTQAQNYQLPYFQVFRKSFLL